jgi:hypothetical protein
MAAIGVPVQRRRFPVGVSPPGNKTVTRVSSQVEFIEADFNGTGVRSSYIKHQVSASDAASR